MRVNRAKRGIDEHAGQDAAVEWLHDRPRGIRAVDEQVGEDHVPLGRESSLARMLRTMCFMFLSVFPVVLDVVASFVTMSASVATPVSPGYVDLGPRTVSSVPTAHPS